MAFPHAAASKGEQFWSCDPLPGFDSKPLFASVEVCGTATASNWVRSWDLGRHRIHPDTGATLLLLFPGEKWRLCLENLDAYREVLVSLHVDGRNAASGGCVRVSPSSKFLWEGWRDGNGNVIAPFVATEMPTIERRLDATEAAAAAEVGGLRIECAYEVMLEAPRPYTFSAGGDGHGPIRGSEPIALSSTKKVDQGLGTAPPPATASAVSRTITSVMGPTHARTKIQIMDDFGLVLLLKDKADLPPVPPPAVVAGAGGIADDAGGANSGKKRRVTAAMAAAAAAAAAAKKPKAAADGVIDLT